MSPRAIPLLVVVLAAISLAPAPPHLSRIALVPLDDRPGGLQEAQLIGAVADAEVIGPPRYRLGRFTSEGDADGIAEWLDSLDLTRVDAVIVSTDMLAYGGEIASRRPAPSQEKALRRIEALGRLKARRKEVQVYTFSTLLSLQPLDDGRKGKWKETLASGPSWWRQHARTERPPPRRRSSSPTIPPTMIELYRTVRARNLAVTNAAIDLVSKGGVDAMAVVATSAAPRGLAGC